MYRFAMALSVNTLLVCAAWLGACGGTAIAGTYRVYSCKTPTGAVAPTDGWSASSIALYASPSNNCAAGGGLSLALNPDVANQATASLMSWGWEAPAGTTIASYRVWRNAQLTGAYEPNATPVAFVARPVNALSGAYLADGCRAAPEGCLGLGGAPGLHPANLLAENLEGVPNVNHWYLSVDCGGVSGYFCVPRPAGQPLAAANVFAAEFTLRDSGAPSVANLAGRATTATTHAGVEQVSYTATDDAAGVYRAFLEVDGKVVSTAVVADNDGRCTDAGVDPATPYEFLYREPCRKSVQHGLPIDTRALSDGVHSVKLLVEDAAGNRTTGWADPEFTVKNAAAATVSSAQPSAGGGSVAVTGGGGAVSSAASAASLCAGSPSGLSVRFRRNGAARLTLTHGSAFRITGRGPGNADIDVFHVRGTKVTALGSFRTAATGRFTERFRASRGSGTLRLCGPAVAKSLTLRVKAKVTLKVRISRRGLVRYSGRVTTGQIPKGGKIVAVQGKAGRSWQTFALRRTDRKGRFKGRYRLRVVRPGARLKFRVRVPSEAGYPFVGIVGKAQTKRVR